MTQVNVHAARRQLATQAAQRILENNGYQSGSGYPLNVQSLCPSLDRIQPIDGDALDDQVRDDLRELQDDVEKLIAAGDETGLVFMSMHLMQRRMLASVLEDSDGMRLSEELMAKIDGFLQGTMLDSKGEI